MMHSHFALPYSKRLRVLVHVFYSEPTFGRFFQAPSHGDGVYPRSSPCIDVLVFGRPSISESESSGLGTPLHDYSSYKTA